MKLFAALVLSLPFAVPALALPSCSDPTTWCEKGSGDAGQSLADAEITAGGPVLTDIIGSIGNGTKGADLYEIMITDPLTFSATSDTGPFKNQDPNPALYLIDLSGHGVYAIDDDSDTNTQATLQAGLGIGPQTAGLYFLIVAPSGNVPVGPGGNPLFTLTVGSDVAADNHVLDHFSHDGCGDGCTGKYDIQLTGANFAEAPEPASVALVGTGILALGFLRRKRRALTR